MAQHHKYTISDMENMFPYERDIYVGLLLAHLEKEKEQLNQG